MKITVTRTGPARTSTVWEHYERLELWSTWAPHLTGVRADSETLRSGAEGTVRALRVVPVAFRVLSVQAALGRWSWRVHPGPLELTLEHWISPSASGGTRAGVTIHGPAAVLVAYRPLMGWALSRLVRVGSGR
ncbi:SRPBCC family protein [Kocuria rhizophila]|uniref:SRPBCC family protein n=1 Tax=Kocuria rhizophila TaxID=72000 RepID=UPI00216926A1|nr:SRPBCC family protein [Kocuria rhizophila]